MPAPTDLILYTIAMSHYSEKVRWLLDFENISYQEDALTPAIHTLPMLFKGGRGQTTVPLIQSGKTYVQDSPRIVEWLAKEYGPLKSLPDEHKDEIIAIQKRFDSIGKAVARYLYYTGFAHKALVLDIWTMFAKPWEARALRFSYHTVKFIFKLKLKINKGDVEKAQQRIDTEIQWLEQRIKTHRFLVGDSLTVADITAAALLAPLACPKEHPIYGTTEFRSKMAQPAQRWENSPALEWVRTIYAQYRGPIWQQLPRVG